MDKIFCYATATYFVWFSYPTWLFFLKKLISCQLVLVFVDAFGFVINRFYQKLKIANIISLIGNGIQVLMMIIQY